MFVLGGLAGSGLGLRASSRPCVSRLHASTSARRHGMLAGAQSKSTGGVQSVSGIIYSAGDDEPSVQLFTKAGCTLCDVAKGVLASASAERPHTLQAVDITDADKAEWWAKYKYDIPVLHINNVGKRGHSAPTRSSPRGEPPLMDQPACSGLPSGAQEARAAAR